MKLARQFLLALIALVFLLAIAGAHLYSPAHMSYLTDKLVGSLHGPGFTAIALIIFVLLRQYRPDRANYVQAGMAAMFVGILSEAAQYPGPRDADIVDLIVDGFGIVAGLGTVALFDKDYIATLGKTRKILLVPVTLIALAMSGLPTLWYSYALIEQNLAAPQLITFEHHWESAIYDPAFSRRHEIRVPPLDWPETAKAVAYFEGRRYSEELFRLYPFSDWREYSSLSFVAASGSDKTQYIRLTIQDARSDGRWHGNRYSEQLEIGPDPRRYEISLESVRNFSDGSPFNIEHVNSIAIWSEKSGEQESILVDDFRLEL